MKRGVDRGVEWNGGLGIGQAMGWIWIGSCEREVDQNGDQDNRVDRNLGGGGQRGVDGRSRVGRVGGIL